ncbi:hypothetical protein [Halorussus halophilus]|uniref:hypothetical protein n=1 Tax=Halorussus halophilus TaxID=2650975 RepID=UPI0013017475|nr:hypothetical protein [Halorussus halophilus]
MEETEVVVELARYLDNQGYTFFVDSGYSSSKVHDLPNEYENCGLNTTITIGRRVPDIIGFTSDEEIFGIEAKGEKAIRKGIGQAAHYRQGVHKSYLAADISSLSEFKDTALSCGLGVIPTEDSGVIESQVEQPVENVGATKLNRIRRALTVRKSRFKSASTSFPSTTRPVNALLPVVAIKEQNKNALTEDEIDSLIERSPQGINSSIHPIPLARTLRLIEKSGDEYQLTDVGDMSYLLLHGVVSNLPKGSLGLDDFESSDMNERIYRALDEFKSPHTKLFEVQKELAAFLRNRYLSVPDVRLLAQVLASHEDSRIELSRVLATVALESPDAFLNLFCRSGAEEGFRDLMENADLAVENGHFREQLLDIAAPNALYNFSYQIWNVGILSNGTDSVHQNDTLEIGKHYWEWDRSVVIGFGEAL